MYLPKECKECISDEGKVNNHIHNEKPSVVNCVVSSTNSKMEWYDNSYVEGGLNPIGWNNPIPRYFLCLFWSIQSITSIGYGNIAPVTTAEYGLANGLESPRLYCFVM